MKQVLSFTARLLVLLLLLAGAGAARADTPIALWKSFDGRVNFTGTQATLRTSSNGSGYPCEVSASGTDRFATLTLPANAVVLSAQLYWAGSGTPDSTVSFNGVQVSAERKYSSTTSGGLDYFGGAADVTAAVKTKGGGSYKFSGLSVSNGSPWCAPQGVLGGFSLLVVYSLASEPERVLNIYEGFQRLQNGSLTLNASNFRWDSNTLPVQEKARIGHITWEGDPTLAQDGERLSFEGTEMTDALNPAGNQFNSQSNINNDKLSHGIDFDAYDTSVTIGTGYDALATTVYKAGQDMVFLSAEILVVPTLPISDLAITIARTGALKIGTDVEYKVTVSNKGSYTEAGPIVVDNTLPPGMYYVSGVVTGWSCTATTTVGKCTYNSTLAPGASAPVLTVRARVSTVGDKTNTVKVAGKTRDDNLANNQASDSGTATTVDGTTTTPPAKLPSYMFTDSRCVSDIAIGAAGQTCKRYTAPTVGGKSSPVWLTATTSAGVPSAANGNNETTASVQFMFECISPSKGTVGARYADTDIPACAPPGRAATWSDVAKIKFPAKTVSVELFLVYKDVGQVRLNLKESNVIASTEVFVSAPWKIAFKRIAHGKWGNPGSTDGTGVGFAPAGARLAVEVGALLYDQSSFAPNFGNESTRPLIEFGSIAADTTTGGVLTERDPEKRSWANGALTTTLSWSEIGAATFTVRADDPNPPPQANPANRYFNVPVLSGASAVGRFYPAYFATEASGQFDCPPGLDARTYACPQKTRGAVYSGQPFEVSVFAYGEDNVRLKNFKGEWFRKVTLHAAKPNGGDALVPDLTSVAGTAPVVIDKLTLPPDPDKVLAKVVYKLPVGYDNKDPRGLKARPTDPTPVHVRAVASELTLAGTIEVSSQRAGEASDEAGVLVLNGRLKLANAIGSDLLKTPMGLRAEYWAGATQGWLINAGYADTRTLGSGQVALANCNLGFLTASGCDTGAAGPVLPQTVAIAGGAGKLWLRAPGKLRGATRAGRYEVEYADPAFPWLPSSTGRVSFGSHRSPVIYVREMYF